VVFTNTFLEALEKFIFDDEGQEWLEGHGWVRSADIIERAIVLPVESEDILEDALVMVVGGGEQGGGQGKGELPPSAMVSRIALLNHRIEGAQG
jgi:hypothetical protein